MHNYRWIHDKGQFVVTAIRMLVNLNHSKWTGVCSLSAISILPHTHFSTQGNVFAMRCIMEKAVKLLLCSY